MVNLTNSVPQLTKAINYDNWSLDEGSSWQPRHMGCGGKWPQRTNKHHKLVQFLDECVESSACEGQGSLVPIVSSC